ncbi:hypothetical protein NQ317_014853 [Molorchus minor]|uniref:ZNFX1 domain-containing protein n=1 Tax=Molorchus minor TaxID=1323400 RepID=A0ABQ9JTK3_9CUCU|nr:hypothetical protein NQ317_014853 [Molorchus minor]
MDGTTYTRNVHYITFLHLCLYHGPRHADVFPRNCRWKRKYFQAASATGLDNQNGKSELEEYKYMKFKSMINEISNLPWRRTGSRKSEYPSRNTANFKNWRDNTNASQRGGSLQRGEAKINQRSNSVSLNVAWGNDRRIQHRNSHEQLQHDLKNIHNPEELMQILLNDKNEFSELLKEDSLSGHWLVLIMHALAKTCESSFNDSKLRIFPENIYVQYLRKQLCRFISNLPNHSSVEKKMNKIFWDDTDRFWNDLLVVFEEIKKLPTFASQNLLMLLKAIIRTLPVLKEEQGLGVSDDIKENFDVLLKMTQNIKNEFVQFQPKERQSQQIEDNIEVPNDFQGPYLGIRHYLDVQFRLLREDFVAPLRRGICQYLENPTQRRYDDIKIYNRIHFLIRENLNEAHCFRIRYSFANKGKHNEDSKQFMHGSLVCFSNDAFKSILFARVVNNDQNYGELIIGFHEIEEISFNTDYVMVLSGIYFEPYYHVLNALKTMSLKHFPMEKYLIYADKVVDVPRYIKRKFLSLLNWAGDLKCGKLNESQWEAYQAALTKEIVIIQGPPVLARHTSSMAFRWPYACDLLHKSRVRSIFGGNTRIYQDIVRIGGRSRNTTLDEYNIKNQKYEKK